MARGGFRPGAGRPRKSRDEVAEKIEVAEKALPQDVEAATTSDVTTFSPLEYLLSVLNDPTAHKDQRFRAAIAAAPYVHPKAEGEVKGVKEKRQEAAKAAAGGGSKFATRKGPQLAVNNG